MRLLYQVCAHAVMWNWGVYLVGCVCVLWGVCVSGLCFLWGVCVSGVCMCVSGVSGVCVSGVCLLVVCLVYVFSWLSGVCVSG